MRRLFSFLLTMYIASITIGCVKAQPMVTNEVLQEVQPTTAVILSPSLPNDSIVPLTSTVTLTFNCDFFEQSREKMLLAHNKNQVDVIDALTAIYQISEKDIERYNNGDGTGSVPFVYRWRTENPYFGTILHWGDGNENALILVGSYSISETPRAFTLGEVIRCLGTPDYTGNYFFYIDEELPYPEDVTGFSLLYNDLELSVNLARPSETDTLTPSTKCYLLGIDVYPTGELEVAAQEAVGGGWSRDAWPPRNWSDTP